MNTSPGYRIELDHLGIDCNRIAPHLYQGAEPPQGTALALAHFDTLVCCARELVPEQLQSAFPGVEVLYCPLRDRETKMAEGDPERDWARAFSMAKQIVARIRRDQRVLVTCAAGLNRSGLVCAMVLHLLTDRPGALCVRHVQRARPGALCQPIFVRALCAVG